MSQPTPANVAFFERHGHRFAYVLIFLIVVVQLLRAAITRANPNLLGGHLGLAEAYLLIVPCIGKGRMGVVSTMFTYLGLFGAAQMLAPESALVLACLALGTQSVLLVIVLLKNRNRLVYQYEK